MYAAFWPRRYLPLQVSSFQTIKKQGFLCTIEICSGVAANRPKTKGQRLIAEFRSWQNTFQVSQQGAKCPKGPPKCPKQPLKCPKMAFNRPTKHCFPIFFNSLDKAYGEKGGKPWWLYEESARREAFSLYLRLCFLRLNRLPLLAGKRVAHGVE